MSKMKQPLTTPCLNELQTVAKQLSNNTSHTILRHLYVTGFGMNGTLVKALGLTQPTVSKQLKALTGSGLVTKQLIRTCKIYSLNRLRFLQLGLCVDIWLR